MIDTAAVLSKGRKKRPMPASLAAPEALVGLKLADTVPLHKAATPGINAIAISPANPSVFVTAGTDKTVCVYDKAEGKKARRQGPGARCLPQTSS
jgi:pre-mRNA-processing factor 19